MSITASALYLDDPIASRKPGKMLARRAEVAKLYRDGEGQIEIARLLGVARKVVTFDLAALRIEWRASSIRDFDALREKELERIDELELEASNAWETSHREDQPDGNPKFLDIKMECIKERCKLIGLYAPTRSDSTVSASVVVAATFHGRDEMKATILEQLARRRTIAGTVGGVVGGGSEQHSLAENRNGNGHHAGNGHHENGNGKPPLQSQ